MKSTALGRLAYLLSIVFILAACGAIQESEVNGDNGVNDENGDNGDNGNGEDCIEETCESLEVECGVHDDGCGGTIDCDECASGYECVKGQCVEVCEEETCETLGVPCGVHDDGCGGTVDCGPCGSCPDDPLCFTPESGQPDAMVDAVSGSPPALTGGEIVDDWYELEKLEFFTDGFLNQMFVQDVTITSMGNTHGSIQFTEDEWALRSVMDVNIQIQSAMADDIAQPMTAPIDLGGCYVAQGNRIVGDILQCGGQWLDEGDPPDGFDYQQDAGRIQLLIIMPKETFTDNLPPDYEMAAMLFEGDLPILMTFTQ